MERTVRIRAAAAPALIAAIAVAGCAPAPAHTAQEYAAAAAVGEPAGSFSTIVGAGTAVVVMSSTVKFPSGDTESGIRNVLMYYRPAARGMCEFQIGHAPKYSSDIVKEAVVTQPCDGKRWAKFRIVGNDFAFVAHVKNARYKNVPVTLLEVDENRRPSSIRLVY